MQFLRRDDHVIRCLAIHAGDDHAWLQVRSPGGTIPVDRRDDQSRNHQVESSDESDDAAGAARLTPAQQARLWGHLGGQIFNTDAFESF